jgi:hypothetical protein
VLAGRKRQALSGLVVAMSTYCRSCQGQRCDGLAFLSGDRGRPWNWTSPEEEDRKLAAARESPGPGRRQLAIWFRDNAGFAVSESTACLILRKEGLMKRPEVQLVAWKEYHSRTTRPSLMWATRRVILPSGGLGLLLPRDRDGWLTLLCPGLEVAERYVGQLPHLGDSGSGRCYRHDPCPC